MKRIAFGLILILNCAICTASEELYYAAPSGLPNVSQDMKRPGFWIERHPSPDEVILNPQEIEKFNLHLKETLKLVNDIANFPTAISGEKFKKKESEGLKELRAKELYRADGSRVADYFYDSVEKDMNLGALAEEARVIFGFIASYANQRILPTNEGLYAKPGSIDFDEVQNSGLDIGTPVAILHKSLDGKWYYVESPLSRGWVEADKAASSELKEIETFRNYKPVVVTDAKADIYLDPGLREYHGYIRMGAVLPSGGNASPQTVEVIVPFRESSGEAFFRKCYMRKDSVREGYLPYTARNIIEQAFKLLNAPYGWGDMRGEQDCSRFIQEVFATTGVILPRNSSDQSRAGSLIAEFDKALDEKARIDLIKTKAAGGLTLLYMKGHIMLFLGMADERPYAIHATWGYRSRSGGKEALRVINRVAVTDLSLGKGSSKGSLLERLLRMTRLSK